MLLSICIPTYNRAEYLNETLRSIVVQDRFNKSFDVEIVISDNCSSDNTSEIANKYVKMYPDKIRYFRNEVNIFDANFEKVLSYGKGEFLKLNNDTLVHKENTLDIIIETVKSNIEAMKILFFSNGTIQDIATVQVDDLDSFIKLVSYNFTWIGCFGIWKVDFDLIKDFNRKAKLRLVQVDILLRLISAKKHVLINNTCIFDSVNPKTKGGYNLFKVFVNNYLSLLRICVKNKQIKKSTYDEERLKLLNEFILIWNKRIISEKKYSFKITGSNYYLIKYYSLIDVLIFNFKIAKYRVNRLIKKILKRGKKTLKRIVFNKFILKMSKIIDKLNFENDWNKVRIQFKSLGDNISIPAPYLITNPQYISIGENFIVRDNFRIEALDSFNNKKLSPEISIGNNVQIESFCHIGCVNKIIIEDGVLIASYVYICDHSHGYVNKEDIESAPIKRELFSKGPVIICKNVWIGEGVKILPNVIIGENSIIGANSVVTHDVPENSVAAGIPARIIKILK